MVRRVAQRLTIWGTPAMRSVRIPCLRLRASLAIGALVVMANLAGSLPAHAASDLQGTIAVAGEGNGNLLSCGGCTLTVATTGYVTGLDGTTPFVVSWGTPGGTPMPASMTLIETASCQGSPVPLVNSTPVPGGTLSVNGAVLIYNGVSQNATVNASFNVSPVTPVAWPVVYLGLTVQTTSLSLSVTVSFAKGSLSVVPASSFVCPTPTEPTNFAVSGTLLSAD